MPDLVHCDLKPENIMITRTGRVVVMDFGIAKDARQASSLISGTLPYMSPEQFSGDNVDARTDLFSAGVILAEMVHPSGIDSEKTREEIWNAVRKDPVQLTESPWKAVILRAVSHNPDSPFASRCIVTSPRRSHGAGGNDGGKETLSRPVFIYCQRCGIFFWAGNGSRDRY